MIAPVCGVSTLTLGRDFPSGKYYQVKKDYEHAQYSREEFLPFRSFPPLAILTPRWKRAQGAARRRG